MQNVIAYISLFFTVMVMQAQSDAVILTNEEAASKYEQGMQKAFKLWSENKPWEAANMFERISVAEPNKWLPPYYVATINVVNSFGEKDKDKLSAQLKKAQDFINDATSISKENYEIMLLQAQLYTAWIVFDGMQYGMKYSPKATELYNKALALEPENPRMILANAEWNIGSAKYFGGSIDSYCADIQRAIDLFVEFKPKGKFYPSFGEERAKQVLAENCE